MDNNSYFDAKGNRVRLDTRHLTYVGTHKSEELMRIREQEQREEDARRAFNGVRALISIPLVAFMFQHVQILYLHPLEVLEALGVIAGGLFVASTIVDIARGGD